MKKILCPIDFSKSSLNGLEYAAQLSRVLEASLLLLYVRASIWPEAIQLQLEVNESDEAIRARLDSLCKETNKEFRIPCRYHLDSTTLTLEESVAANALDADLVVMGTNGADNFYQYVFGTNSFHVVEKTKCPVLIIPENVFFSQVKLMVYAYDPDTNPIFLIDQLKKLALPIGASVKVLHIEEERPSKDVDRRLEILSDAIETRAPRNINWSFNSQYSTEVGLTINQFMKENKADMLALSFHHRSFFEKLFKENTIKKISMIADYPVFVFWH